MKIIPSVLYKKITQTIRLPAYAGEYLWNHEEQAEEVYLLEEHHFSEDMEEHLKVQIIIYSMIGI